MNKVFLIGNLAADPELSQTSSNISYCRFRIAVNRPYRSNDGKEQTDFFSIITWRAVAENCGKYLKKGSKVAVVGSLQTNAYEKNGEKRYTTDIVAENVEFLNSFGKGAEDSYAPDQRKAKIDDLQEIDDDDSLPF